MNNLERELDRATELQLFFLADEIFKRLGRIDENVMENKDVVMKLPTADSPGLSMIESVGAPIAQQKTPSKELMKRLSTRMELP